MNNKIIKRGTILEGNDLEIEYRNRKKPELEKSIILGAPIPERWEVKKTFKTRIRIAQKKSIDIELEDKVWKLFYELGIKKISSRDFSIILRDKNGIQKTRQRDVIAIDDEVIFVVECKSQERLGKKILKKDIAEFADNMHDMRVALKNLLPTSKTQFVFIFATENIQWDENDMLDAQEKKIFIWNEYDILSLQNLANLAGEGAKYQIFNRIFYGKKVKNFEISIPALKSKMGRHTFYSFVLPPEHLLKISYVHHRYKLGQFKFLDLSDSYQRMINKNRIRKIEQFIREEGFFPGSIIVNFRRKFTKEDKLGEKKQLDRMQLNAKPVVITLPPYYGCAWIIDGQHRLYGYADIKEKKTENLPVVAFVEVDDNLQAKIFTDINKNQKSIESDLLWDLYEDLYPESQEEKEQQLYTISMIAKKLNNEKTSPFYKTISIPKEQNIGNITLTTVCTIINQQKLIAKNEGLLFYKSYEETMHYAAERISCFFNAIKKELSDEWQAGDRHYVRTNAGFVVLLGILRDIIECNIAKLELENIDKFKKVVDKFLHPLLYHLLDADSARMNVILS